VIDDKVAFNIVRVSLEILVISSNYGRLLLITIRILDSTKSFLSPLTKKFRNKSFDTACMFFSQFAYQKLMTISDLLFDNLITLRQMKKTYKCTPFPKS
jgi:hypothetical protein